MLGQPLAQPNPDTAANQAPQSQVMPVPMNPVQAAGLSSADVLDIQPHIGYLLKNNGDMSRSIDSVNKVVQLVQGGESFDGLKAIAEEGLVDEATIRIAQGAEGKSKEELQAYQRELTNQLGMPPQRQIAPRQKPHWIEHVAGALAGFADPLNAGIYSSIPMQGAKARTEEEQARLDQQYKQDYDMYGTRLNATQDKIKSARGDFEYNRKRVDDLNDTNYGFKKQRIINKEIQDSIGNRMTNAAELKTDEASKAKFIDDTRKILNDYSGDDERGFRGRQLLEQYRVGLFKEVGPDGQLDPRYNELLEINSKGTMKRAIAQKQYEKMGIEIENLPAILEGKIALTTNQAEKVLYEAGIAKWRYENMDDIHKKEMAMLGLRVIAAKQGIQNKDAKAAIDAFDRAHKVEIDRAKREITEAEKVKTNRMNRREGIQAEIDKAMGSLKLIESKKDDPKYPEFKSFMDAEIARLKKKKEQNEADFTAAEQRIKDAEARLQGINSKDPRLNPTPPVDLNGFNIGGFAPPGEREIAGSTLGGTGKGLPSLGANDIKENSDPAEVAKKYKSMFPRAGEAAKTLRGLQNMPETSKAQRIVIEKAIQLLAPKTIKPSTTKVPPKTQYEDRFKG